MFFILFGYWPSKMSQHTTTECQSAQGFILLRKRDARVEAGRLTISVMFYLPYPFSPARYTARHYKGWSQKKPFDGQIKKPTGFFFAL